MDKADPQNLIANMIRDRLDSGQTYTVTFEDDSESQMLTGRTLLGEDGFPIKKPKKSKKKLKNKTKTGIKSTRKARPRLKSSKSSILGPSQTPSTLKEKNKKISDFDKNTIDKPSLKPLPRLSLTPPPESGQVPESPQNSTTLADNNNNKNKNVSSSKISSTKKSKNPKSSTKKRTLQRGKSSILGRTGKALSGVSKKSKKGRRNSKTHLKTQLSFPKIEEATNLENDPLNTDTHTNPNTTQLSNNNQENNPKNKRPSISIKQSNQDENPNKQLNIPTEGEDDIDQQGVRDRIRSMFFDTLEKSNKNKDEIPNFQDKDKKMNEEGKTDQKDAKDLESSTDFLFNEIEKNNNNKDKDSIHPSDGDNEDSPKKQPRDIGAPSERNRGAPPKFKDPKYLGDLTPEDREAVKLRKTDRNARQTDSKKGIHDDNYFENHNQEFTPDANYNFNQKYADESELSGPADRKKLTQKYPSGYKMNISMVDNHRTPTSTRQRSSTSGLNPNTPYTRHLESEEEDDPNIDHDMATLMKRRLKSSKLEDLKRVSIFEGGKLIEGVQKDEEIAKQKDDLSKSLFVFQKQVRKSIVADSNFKASVNSMIANFILKQHGPQQIDEEFEESEELSSFDSQESKKGGNEEVGDLMIDRI